MLTSVEIDGTIIKSRQDRLAQGNWQGFVTSLDSPLLSA